MRAQLTIVFVLVTLLLDSVFISLKILTFLFFVLYVYRCDRRKIPVVMDLEYDTFITEHVPRTQLLVVSVTSSL